MTLIDPVPWGRSHAEYRAFFGLGGLPPTARVLDVAGGPSSFTAERSAAGGPTVACDPLYDRPAAGIAAGVEAARRAIMARVRAAPERYLWTSIASPDELERIRLAAMGRFLADYEAGRAAGRYRSGALPDLPFAADSFDLALSSHLLFTYSEGLDLAFHLAAARELLRVAPEARVFPLLNHDAGPSPHLEPLIGRLTAEGLRCERRRVGYQFQRGGDEMLVLTRGTAPLATLGPGPQSPA
ncbi:hypothetical protein SAMN06265365_101570 [Tistlia consotensis]|uniref:Methyltransferase domain-containing protein n=1 Tax=Tistlia consotensis USBA 355 TaxID=560819 RepID=A0A1Y6B6R8_9PROT|nr:hypothetical protein [Tistlia consotensis]SME93261.1 hypothetical protein SAMN05428998_101569 [Tistlia consotensis USBA 355]SNR28533.1 hypothetical protein SAMN06265365_101570 [Tistlia consotensis]